MQRDSGVNIVPHSINLSRSDFESCDIVEEIRKRVDASGIQRDRISIEITESTIGTHFDFMKHQIQRFQELGFPVWMDDFGNGYSSLDVLQSIRFDLLKFDMGFMKKLDAGDNGSPGNWLFQTTRILFQQAGFTGKYNGTAQDRPGSRI